MLLALPSVMAYSETRYVSDELVLSLRAGKGDGSKIIDYLKSDTPVEVLSEEGDFLLVRTPEGKEGWVRKHYITSEAPKAQVIAKLKKEIESMKATIGESKDVTGESDRLRAENERLAEKNRKLEEKLDSVGQKEMIHWFLAGASVLLVGWLIGRISRQKRFY
jgi:SH3 domain protein